MHFRGGREAVDAKAYPDMDEFYADLARVYREEIHDLAAAGLPLSADRRGQSRLSVRSRLRAQVRNIGEDPATLPSTYARLLNDAIAGQPADMMVCMHLCRGNFAGAWVAEGGYDPIAELLFNEIAVDGYFLEYDIAARRRLRAAAFLAQGQDRGARPRHHQKRKLESKDELKRRIDEAAPYARSNSWPLPQCGFSSGDRRQRHDDRRRDGQAQARRRNGARGLGIGMKIRGEQQ